MPIPGGVDPGKVEPENVILADVEPRQVDVALEPRELAVDVELRRIEVA